MDDTSVTSLAIYNVRKGHSRQGAHGSWEGKNWMHDSREVFGRSWLTRLRPVFQHTQSMCLRGIFTNI